MQEKQWFKQSELAGLLGMTPIFFGKHLIALGLKDLFSKEPTLQALKSGLAKHYKISVKKGFIQRIMWAKRVLELVKQRLYIENEEANNEEVHV